MTGTPRAGATAGLPSSDDDHALLGKPAVAPKYRIEGADQSTWQPQLLDGEVSVFLQEANRLFQSVSAEWLRQDFRTSIDNRVDNRGFA